MHSTFEDYLLSITQASSCREIEVIQSLWSGYGKISRYQLQDSPLETVVIKCITLKTAKEHPRGWNSAFAHNRKVKSYQVETQWYQQWNHLCTPLSPTPNFMGSYTQGEQQWIVLEDLNEKYPLRKNSISLTEVKTCIKWLANFHGTFINASPNGLWEIGSYWHLATRPHELEQLEHQELKARATQIDTLLNNAQYQTIIHGDAKLANFCFSRNGQEVAAVDFQYVGRGCGMKDLVYFLSSCLNSEELAYYEQELLDYYFSELIQATPSSININELIDEWTNLYPIASTDFTRFLLGWMPGHQKINAYSLAIMQSVLARLA